MQQNTPMTGRGLLRHLSNWGRNVWQAGQCYRQGTGLAIQSFHLYLGELLYTIQPKTSDDRRWRRVGKLREGCFSEMRKLHG